jgi:Fe2+ transport system protein FeoA
MLIKSASETRRILRPAPHEDYAVSVSAAIPQPAESLRASLPVRLSDLPVGRTARFLAAQLAPQDCALLGAIGLTERCLLRVCQKGEPCIIQVRATRIGLSRAVADGILVVPEGAA